MDQSLVPDWSAAVVIGDGGKHHLPCCVMEVMCSSSPCMPMKSLAVQILAGSMACVCHTVITYLKVAHVCGFLQCVTLSSYVQQCLICKIVVVTSQFVRWRQRLRLCLLVQVTL